MTDLQRELNTWARDRAAERERAEAEGRIPETAHDSTNPTARRIWAALHEPLGHQHRLAAIAGRVGVTIGTVRNHVKEWAAAGYVHYGSGVARLAKGARPMPPSVEIDCGGKLVYIHYPDEDVLTVVDRTHDARHPIVTQRRRGTPGPAGEVVLHDKRSDETLAAYYERKSVEAARAYDEAVRAGEDAAPAAKPDPYGEWDQQLGPARAIDMSTGDDAPEPPATLPAVPASGTDLPALLDAGHRALAQATTNIERLRVRDGARAYQEAARVLKRADVLVDASILVQTAERAIAVANPGRTRAETGRGRAIPPAEIDIKLISKIRAAHAHVDEGVFRSLVAGARESAEPLTRKRIAQAGRDARGAASPKTVHYTGNFEWTTPPHIIEAARRVMGGIDLDPASSDAAQAVVQARKYYTAHEDGLKRAWAGRVWLNPPYERGLVQAFVGRLGEHIASGKATEALLLTNNSTDTAWWQGAASHALAVCMLAGRLRYLTPSGAAVGAAIQGQAILYFARDVDDAIERFHREFRRHGIVLGPCPDRVMDVSGEEDGP